MNALSLKPFFSKLDYLSILIESCFSTFFDNIYKESNDDQCDADYVGFTTRHLHQRIQEHRYSAIGKHLINILGGIDTSSLSIHFSILKNVKLSLIVFCMK